MGYTHYWETAKKIDKKNWKVLMGAVNILFKGCEKTIQKEYTDTSEAEVNIDRIRFNGIGEDGHETFLLSREGRVSEWAREERKNSSTPCFGFCKTARKPYDEYVTAVLILAKLYLGDQIKLSSDGTALEWQSGVDLINDKMGWKLKIYSSDDDISNAEFEQENKTEV